MALPDIWLSCRRSADRRVRLASRACAGMLPPEDSRSGRGHLAVIITPGATFPGIARGAFWTREGRCRPILIRDGRDHGLLWSVAR